MNQQSVLILWDLSAVIDTVDLRILVTAGCHGTRMNYRAALQNEEF